MFLPSLNLYVSHVFQGIDQEAAITESLILLKAFGFLDGEFQL